MVLLKQFEENAKKYQNDVFLADSFGNRLTFSETYEFSSRVYRYLKNKGIGNEDFVLICLPRNVYPLASSMGVLRVGAAFVLVEDTLPAERIEYIRQNCGCKWVIDQNCMTEILNTEPLEGYEKRDDHSAAFAVYTSGTTGTPKGVLHEYGNIERTITSTGPLIQKNVRFILCSPLNFIFSAVTFLVGLVKGVYYYVVPFATVRDPLQLKALLLKEKINMAFLSPLFTKKMAPILSSLECCLVGSEPANNLYSHDFTICNGYSMSEVGFIIAVFKIDKEYPNTPVGNSLANYPIRLVDENGNDVPRGEKGEIIVENPYVRGYIGLPERTAASFKNGWFHTGDLGKWDEEGRLVIVGRLDEMEKVNGNRVEPGEIEITAVKALNLSWAAAKVAHDHERSAVCLYYIDNIVLNPEEARAKLKEFLPPYMLPSFFIHVDKIPLTPAGKFNRRGLPSPNLNEDRPPYKAPESEIQKALCEAFSQVLHIAPIGIDDDFTKLGGDSIGVMDVVILSKLESLSAVDVLVGHTPKETEKLYLKHKDEQNVDEINTKALLKNYPLTADQAYTTEWQLKEPESTMRSIHTLMKFDKNTISMTKMAQAVTKAMRNHPALYTEFYYEENKELRQRFSPAILKDVQVEHLTEAELNEFKKTLVQPFTMIETPLFRARVFETEKAGYVFADVHHTVFDGSSYRILLSDIALAYQDKELSKDYYPYILDSKGIFADSQMHEENKAYFTKKYSDVNWCTHLTSSGEAKNSEVGITNQILPITIEQLSKLEKQTGVSKNGVFAIATALATSIVEQVSHVMLFWTFNGRTDSHESCSIGSLRCGLPIALSIEKDTTFEALCKEVSNQINNGIAHCRYPYLEENPSILDEGVIRVLYQGSLGTPSMLPGLLETIPLAHANTVSRAFVNLEIVDQADKISLVMKYTKNCYSPEKINSFLAAFNNVIDTLAERAIDPSVTLGTLIKK